jgi:ribose 5-phosphate isomerase A
MILKEERRQTMEWDVIKQAIGEYCAKMAPSRGLVGLGSGSTSKAFIHALAQRCREEDLSIQCLPTSLEIELLAKTEGLKVVDRDWSEDVLVIFDGADAVDEEGTAIKGAGGALVREKIAASSSRKRVLMVDERKWKRPWRECLLPVAVLPFGRSATMKKINLLGLTGTVRKHGDQPFVTNDGLCIIDLVLPEQPLPLNELDRQLKTIPGVVETGVFFHVATEIVIGYGDGKVTRVPL